MGVTYANGQLPLPNGAYGYSGVGAIYLPGWSPVVEEWSASKSPYYTYGEAVLRNGLVYYLNYAWNGSTIGAPESQVDGGGNRVWSLWSGGTKIEQYYDQVQLKNLTNGPRIQWGLRGCHALMYDNYIYDGAVETLFDHSMERDPKPAAYFTSSGDISSFSVDVGAELSIPSNLFKFVLTSGGNHPSSTIGNLVGGIFDSLKDYPYLTNGDPLGALHYSESISYTLEEKNWWMTPEYDAPTPLPTRTFTYTNLTGGTVNRTIDDWMIFIPETFIGRTYTGAFRVYKKYDDPTVLIERIELDSVTPDLTTD